MSQIDDTAYRNGRAAFVDGASLRTIAEQFMAAEAVAPPNANACRQREDLVISLALGFVDAAFDKLRGIEQ